MNLPETKVLCDGEADNSDLCKTREWHDPSYSKSLASIGEEECQASTVKKSLIATSRFTGIIPEDRCREQLDIGEQLVCRLMPLFNCLFGIRKGGVELEGECLAAGIQQCSQPWQEGALLLQ
jgi:hypothetical protein